MYQQAYQENTQNAPKSNNPNPDNNGDKGNVENVDYEVVEDEKEDKK